MKILRWSAPPDHATNERKRRVGEFETQENAARRLEAKMRLTELEVDIKVLLIESLKTRVKERTERSGSGLLDNFGSSPLRVVVGSDGTQTVDVHGVVGLELVVTVKIYEEDRGSVGGTGELLEDANDGKRGTRRRRSSRSNDEVELVRWDSHRLENGEQEMTVVRDSVSDESKRSLLRVKESVDIWRRREGGREGGEVSSSLPSSLFPCESCRTNRRGEP